MDTIKRSSIGIFSFGFLCYIGYTFLQGTVIIQEGIAPFWNTLSYVLLGSIFMYFLMCYSLTPRYIKRAKLINISLGILIISVGYFILANDLNHHLYIGDITTVVGVITTFVSMSNIMKLKKIKQQKENKEMEIIEV